MSASAKSFPGTVRVLFSCTGIGICNRGVESLFREAFDGLKTAPALEARLIKGRGPEMPDEWRVPCLHRDGLLCKWIGRAAGRSGYAVEQWSSFWPVARRIRAFQPQVVFTAEANLMYLLHRFRTKIGVPFRLLYSNGGPIHPPFIRCDAVLHSAPVYYDEALAYGEPREKHFMLPQGIRICAEAPPGAEEKTALRTKLGLPQDRKIVLSVGWISKRHKRMDFIVETIARLPEPRPFLGLLGAMDDSSAEILSLAERLLGRGSYLIKSVPYEDVKDYYRSADLFVLGSLREGFGRVFLEALMHGLPVIGHKHPAIEYVLGSVGTAADLTDPARTATIIRNMLQQPDSMAAKTERWKYVEARFAWPSLRSPYQQMFAEVARGPMRPADAQQT